jgi:arylsulfatase A-like enzyme
MNRKRHGAAIGAVVAILPFISLVSLVSGCTPEPTARSKPNFILFSIDTLRADHLGCHGYTRKTSPNVDRFAEGSIRYANAFAPAPWTLPSHASMLTGRHPYTMGIWDLDSRIPADVPLLAETLANQGYSTAGFVDSLDSGLVGSNRGFGRGFDAYYHSPHGAPSDYKYDVNRTFDAAFDWLDRSRGDAAFFLFLHTKSVHSAPYVKNNPRQGDSPYDQPGRTSFRFLPEGKTQFRWRDNEGNRGTRYLREVNQRISRGEFDRSELSDAKIEELIGLYDGGIRYVDDAFQRLIDYLEANQLSSNTVIIVTSDHGEGFLEHDYLLHQEVHRQLLQVPLIIRDPRSPGGRVIEALVSLEDLVPTILRRAEIDPPTGLQGRPLPETEPMGQDDVESRRRLFSYFRFDKVSGRQAFSLHDVRGRVIAERNDDRETIDSHYYDLREDPDELYPLETPGEEMMSELLSWVESGAEAHTERIDLDDENIDRLRALGYVE